MGYWVRKLKYIPTTFDWYLFLVGDYRNHSIVNDFFRNDFFVIADRIGENAGLIAQNRELETELQDSLKCVERGKLGKMIKKLEKGTPGLLIINKHPKFLNPDNRMTEIGIVSIPDDLDESKREQFLMEYYNENRAKYTLSKDTFILYIPFTRIEEAYNNQNELMEDLVSFCCGCNKEFIKKTSKKGKIMRNISASIGLNLGVVAINFDWS